MPQKPNHEGNINKEGNKEKAPIEPKNRMMLKKEVQPLEMESGENQGKPKRFAPYKGKSRKDEEKYASFHVKMIHMIKEETQPKAHCGTEEEYKGKTHIPEEVARTQKSE